MLPRSNQRAPRGHLSGGRGRAARGDPNSSDAPPNAFDRERIENAAKREQRGQQTSDHQRGRGRGESSVNNNRGSFTKHSSAHNGTGRPRKEASPAAAPNPFATSKSTTSSPFASPVSTANNPFANKPKPSAPSNPFGASNGNAPVANPFGAPSQPAPPGRFGAPFSNPPSSGFGALSSTTPSVFGAPSSNTAQLPTNPFGAPTTQDGVQPSSFNPFASNSRFDTSAQTFGSTTPASASPFATSSGGFSVPSSTPTLPSSMLFGAPSQPSFGSNNASLTSGAVSNPTNTFGGTPTFSTSGPNPPQKPIGTPKSTVFAGFSTTSSSNTRSGLGAPNSAVSASKKFVASPAAPIAAVAPSMPVSKSQANQNAFQTDSISLQSPWALKLSAHLKKERIFRPSYPGKNAGNPEEQALVETFYRGALKTYRDKVRTSFMKAGLMDDPDKPKRLSEAIDFKGTCEDMCPFKEKFERLIERSTISAHEMECSTGERLPSLEKMVKRHSRSAAGDEEPLPEDVRSPAALRRTVDYLFTTFLGSDEGLIDAHDFLWDRTRAIRRDFVFQAALSDKEMIDQIYCLENIIRFHVLALHQMSKRGIKPSQFNEQQEIEQLSKSMISLMHAYGDCESRGLQCENEEEFRAYHVVFNGQSSTILEAIADANPKFGYESEKIQAAVNLVECMQTCWEGKGPLKAFRPTIMANNAFSKFFRQVASNNTWYLLACFAEIHFNSMRKAALKTILSAYRKQREQTKDWTLLKLQNILNFDTYEDIITFGEAYGLHFEELDGETYLSLEFSPRVKDAAKPKQIFSSSIVEVKRGPLTLSEVISGAVHRHTMNPNEHGGIQIKNSETGAVKGALGAGAFTTKIQSTSQIGGQKEGGSQASMGGKQNQLPPTSTQTMPQSASTIEETLEAQAPALPAFSFGSLPSTQATSKPSSILDQVKTVQSFGSEFSTRDSTPTVGSSIGDQPASSRPPKEVPSLSFPQSSAPQSAASSPFSFLQSQPKKTVDAPANQPLSLGNYAVTRAPAAGANLGLSATQATEALSAVESTGSTFGSHKTSEASTPAVEATRSSNPSNVSTVQSPLPSPAFDVQPAQQLSNSTMAVAPTSTPSAPIPRNNPFAAFTQNKLAATSTASIDDSAYIQPSPFVKPSNEVSTQAAPPNDPLNMTTNSNPFAVSQPTPPNEVDRRFDVFTDWYVKGENGIIPQITEHLLERLLMETFRGFKEEEAARTAQEKFKQATQMAIEHRINYLSVKFLERWRRITHLKGVRRRKLEAIQLRKEMFEASVAKKSAEAANLVEDFKASTRSGGRKQFEREQSMEAASASTRSLNGVQGSSVKIRKTGNPSRTRTHSSSQRHEDSSLRNSQSADKRRRGDKSQSSKPSGNSTTIDPLRRSLLDHPSYLSGESQILYMKKWTLEDEMRDRPSGTVTDYFRLKARGIHTMPDGTPLASSAATEYRKKLLDDLAKPNPLRRSTNSYGRSMSSRGYEDSEPPISGVGPVVDVSTLKANARAFVEQDKTSRKRRSPDIDDEDAGLTGRVKRFKERTAGGEEIRSVEVENDGERTSKKRRSVDDTWEAKKRRLLQLKFSEEEIEVLARAERVKQQLDEGKAWYREQLERDSQERESLVRIRSSRSFDQY